MSARHLWSAATTGKTYIGLLALTLWAALPLSAVANPVVRISTTFGDFSVELFDEETPLTVQNFLGYVERGDYRGNFIHRLEPDFVVQTGGYRFVPFQGPVEVPERDPVPNEPGISNTRGTLAMAKRGGDPDSATSQWFVNLSDNSENLDEQNGGFTVFGRVLGDGMDVVDMIADQEDFDLAPEDPSDPFSSVPLRDFSRSFPVDENFIKISPVRMSRFTSSLHVFDTVANRLITSVDGGEGLGPHVAHLRLVAEEPRIIFELEPRSLMDLAIEPEGMASWSADTQRLEIPRVEISTPTGASVITDVVFSLESEQPMRFVLESYQQP